MADAASTVDVASAADTANEKSTDKKSLLLYIAALQVGLFIFSLGGVCSKLAGREDFLSFGFFLFYGLLMVTLAVYAVIWQQVLKKIPLTIAYGCKGIIIVYGMLWGALLFSEKITLPMIAGGLLVLIGVGFFLAEGDGGGA